MNGHIQKSILESLHGILTSLLRYQGWNDSVTAMNRACAAGQIRDTYIQYDSSSGCDQNFAPFWPAGAAVKAIISATVTDSIRSVADSNM